MGFQITEHCNKSNREIIFPYTINYVILVAFRVASHLTLEDIYFFYIELIHDLPLSHMMKRACEAKGKDRSIDAD